MRNEFLLFIKDLFLSIVLKIVMFAQLPINTTPSTDPTIYFFVCSSPQLVAGLGQIVYEMKNQLDAT
jgi:hypothetical protein